MTKKEGFIVLLVLAFGSYQPVFSDDDGLCFFDTEDEAQAAIDECVQDTIDAVKEGDMDETYSQEDYCVAPATLEGTTIECMWEGAAYQMDRSEDDWHWVADTVN